MTRYDMKVAAYALVAVVLLGLGLGYVVGRAAPPPNQDLVATSAPPEFDGGARADGGGPTVDGIPGWADLYVNDYQDLLDDGAEAALRADLIELYDQTGIEMTVLTISEMIAYGHTGTIEELATKTFNAWGIGDAGRNDGVLVLVSRFDRAMRIEVGAGFGARLDDPLAEVIADHFLPAFLEDKYQEGILRGVEETIFTVAGAYPGTYDQPVVQRGWGVIARRAQDVGAAILAPILAALGAAWIAFRRYLRRRPRPCPDCRAMMEKAPETTEDAHLNGGQKLEEFLGSVDYDVWHCPDCAHITVHGYKRWGGRHSVCTDCGFRTFESTSTVLEAATTSRAGRKRLDYKCRHCGHSDHEIRTIPKISDSKSSSSSGGSSRSSFGGGRSSGGGASGRW